MNEVKYCLLTEPLISVRLSGGGTRKLTLPGVLFQLGKEGIKSFMKLQPHQEHAWYSFLVQLSAIVLSQSQNDSPEGITEETWEILLKGLTSDYELSEPWSLCVDDLLRPAFLQPPVLEKSLSSFKGPVDSPDAISILIRSKNHDIKLNKMLYPVPENWIYGLVTLQTMQGFLGSGNYGISRMNGGFSSRPCVTVTSGNDIGTRYRRDVSILLKKRSEIVKNYEYKHEKGYALLWTLPWDGKTSLSLNECDPYFIELCRRVRLRSDSDKIVVYQCATKASRIAAAELKGKTGDPWTPIDITKNATLTMSSVGFTYENMCRILFNENFQPGITQILERSDSDMQVYAKVVVRGQGKTEGIYERRIPIPNKVKLCLRKSHDEHVSTGRYAKQMIEIVNTVLLKILKPSVLQLAQGAPEKLNFKDNRCDTSSRRVKSQVDDTFFKWLWMITEKDEEKDLEKWICKIIMIAKKELERAEQRIPIPHVRFYRAVSAAWRTFYGAVKKNFPEINIGGKVYDTGSEKQA